MSYLFWNGKTGLCEDNDIINDVNKIFYHRCNKTNSEATACELCLDGYELRDGLCFDEQYCIERNENGTCKKCQKTEDEYYEHCLRKVFGCIEGYYDENFLECNDLNDVGKWLGVWKNMNLTEIINLLKLMKNYKF